MARTLAQLRQAVEDIGYGADTASATDGFLNAEWRNLASMRRWSWLMTTSTGTLSAGFTAIALNAAVNGSIEGIWFTDSTGAQVRPVKYLEPVKLAAYTNDSAVTGPPRYWTLMGTNIVVWPVADANYTATYLYSSVVLDMVADGDTPFLLPKDFDDILVWGAVSRQAVRQNNWLTRDYADQQREKLINRMLAAEGMTQRQTPDEVEATGIWSQPDPLRDFWPWR